MKETHDKLKDRLEKIFAIRAVVYRNVYGYPHTVAMTNDERHLEAVYVTDDVILVQELSSTFRGPCRNRRTFVWHQSDESLIDVENVMRDWIANP